MWKKYEELPGFSLPRFQATWLPGYRIWLLSLRSWFKWTCLLFYEDNMIKPLNLSELWKRGIKTKNLRIVSPPLISSWKGAMKLLSPLIFLGIWDCQNLERMAMTYLVLIATIIPAREETSLIWWYLRKTGKSVTRCGFFDEGGTRKGNQNSLWN